MKRIEGFKRKHEIVTMIMVLGVNLKNEIIFQNFFLSILLVKLFHELFQILILIRYHQREFHSTWRYDFWTSEAFVGSYHVTHMHSTTYDRTYDQVTSKFSGLNLDQFKKKNCSFWIEKPMKSLN